jgi:uncharacterized protein
VSRRGDNLPAFLATQLAFAAHVRNPDVYPRPTDVEPRRMQIYVDLFYNNIEALLASVFPVAKAVLEGERWRPLVRDFVHRHPSETPYFLEISQEFLTFLADTQPPGLPPFLLELCHYEWVELALSVAEEEIPEEGVDPAGDVLRGVPVVSPLIWKLAYHFPVHQIGPEFQPHEPGRRPTQLVVYRRRDDSVGFMEVSTLTMALLDAIEPGNVTGAQALAQIAADAPGLDPEVARREVPPALERLRKAGIILGTKPNPE